MISSGASRVMRTTADRRKRTSCPARSIGLSETCSSSMACTAPTSRSPPSSSQRHASVGRATGERLGNRTRLTASASNSIGFANRGDFQSSVVGGCPATVLGTSPPARNPFSGSSSTAPAERSGSAAGGTAANAAGKAANQARPRPAHVAVTIVRLRLTRIVSMAPSHKTVGLMGRGH